MHESKPVPAAVHPSDAKQLFMECLQASDDSSREQLLSAADPKLAEEVRGLLGDMDHGGLIDQVFGMTGDPSLVDPKATVDSNGDQSEATGNDPNGVDPARPGRHPCQVARRHGRDTRRLAGHQRHLAGEAAVIINGASRSNGAFFARHLLRADQNERVTVMEMRGFPALRTCAKPSARCRTGRKAAGSKTRFTMSTSTPAPTRC